jgi:hypothetical protein
MKEEYIYHLSIINWKDNKIFHNEFINCRETLLLYLRRPYCFKAAEIKLESDDPDNIHKVFSKIKGVEIKENVIYYNNDCILYYNLPLLSLLLFMSRHGLDLNKSSIKKIIDIYYDNRDNSYKYYIDYISTMNTAFGLYLHLNKNKKFLEYNRLNDMTNYNGIATYISNNFNLYRRCYNNFCRRYGNA